MTIPFLIDHSKIIVEIKKFFLQSFGYLEELRNCSFKILGTQTGDQSHGDGSIARCNIMGASIIVRNTCALYKGYFSKSRLW